MLEKVKKALHRSNNIFDDEIIGYINACYKDLERVGISSIKIKKEASDPVITHVTICYCKWQTNFQNKGEIWGKIYKELRQDIALDGDYRC